jgi:excisionase family DNA binding protein
MMNNPYQRNSHSLTPSQAARYLGVKVGTIYSYLSRGELSASKIGHHRSISLNQLERFGNGRVIKPRNRRIY